MVVHAGDARGLGEVKRWLAEVLAGDIGYDIMRLKGEVWHRIWSNSLVLGTCLVYTKLSAGAQVAVRGHELRLLVQAVQEMFDVFETTAWGTDARTTRLVVVGRNVDGKALQEHFVQACC